MATIMMDQAEKIRESMQAVDRRIEFTDLETLEDIENSELNEVFQERIRYWKRTRSTVDLSVGATEFRSTARLNGYNLKLEPAIMFIDIYWEFV